jgi:hypothetical protein
VFTYPVTFPCKPLDLYRKNVSCRRASSVTFVIVRDGRRYLYKWPCLGRSLREGEGGFGELPAEEDARALWRVPCLAQES